MAKAEKKKNPTQFMREVRQETSKVTWPSRRETTLTTIMVFIMVTLIAIFLFVTDQILAEVIQFILGIGN